MRHKHCVHQKDAPPHDVLTLLYETAGVASILRRVLISRSGMLRA